MRLDPDGAIVLSKRNVQTLLNKVDDDWSAKTLAGGSDAPGVVVKVETDEEHYGRPDRKYKVPGPVHPDHDPGPWSQWNRTQKSDS